MDALGWTVEDVAAWLTRIGLPAGVTATFEAKQVDGPTLLELSDEDLHQSLAVEDVIHRRKIKGHIEALKLRAAQAATPSRNAYARSTPRRADGLGQPRDFTPRDDGLYLKRNGGGRSQRSFEGALDSAWADGSGGGSRYSQLLSRSATAANVDTSFGWDSPSYSIKGSFPRAPRVKRADPTFVAGPATYSPSDTEHTHKRGRSPRACIGHSPRNTSEHFEKFNTAPGAGQYNPDHLTSRGNTRVRGGVIAASPRFKHYAAPSKEPFSPGPADYNVRHTYRSNFR
jgi:hypothetical protein